MSGQHARLSASSAYRWMVCAGSVGGEGESSIHAATGTFAHDISAQCLKDQTLKPLDFLGKKAKVDGFDVECDMEMVEGVRVYLDAVDADMKEGDLIWIEMPLLDALKRLDKDFGGTSDYVRYRPSTKNLLVGDFKYGAGVYVEVTDNVQLHKYAVGALLEIQALGYKVETVTSMVIQPRYEAAEAMRTETFKAFELMDFIADMQEAAERTRLPNPPLVAGDHCKFCPKRRTCPELEKRHHAIIAMADLAVVPLVDVAKALEAIPLVKARIAAIEEHAYKMATQGAEIPGYKLVDKLARRQWKSEGDVVMWAQEQAIDAYAPREVLSPSKLEEKLKETAPRGKKKKEAGKAIEHLWIKQSSGTTLVPLTDNRPAVKRLVESDFAAVDGPAKQLAAPAVAIVNLF